MFVMVSPLLGHMSETLTSLKFAIKVSEHLDEIFKPGKNLSEPNLSCSRSIILRLVLRRRQRRLVGRESDFRIDICLVVFVVYWRGAGNLT